MIKKVDLTQPWKNKIEPFRIFGNLFIDDSAWNTFLDFCENEMKKIANT